MFLDRTTGFKKSKTLRYKKLPSGGFFFYNSQSLGLPGTHPAPARLYRVFKKQVHKNFLILSSPVNTLFHEQ
jgi:hypothetical protein